MPGAQGRPPDSSILPSTFVAKKSQILAVLNTVNYTDKSPKGSVDAEIIELIDELNAFEKYVTTSSCAGRIAVFVEGHKTIAGHASTEADETGERVTVDDANGIRNAPVSGAGPGGKGHGNKWLFVSHGPVPSERLSTLSPTELHELFALTPQSDPAVSSVSASNLRLVKISFSPLILHVLCSSLQAAKPLLAAAINAGFRESGVQSLKALDDEDAGVMVAIRTAGLGFESVVGIVDEHTDAETGQVEEVYRSCVDEYYLRMCVTVINERFAWNDERRERFRRELRKVDSSIYAQETWEDATVRRERKKAEGLRRKEQMCLSGDDTPILTEQEEVTLNGGLFLDAT